MFWMMGNITSFGALVKIIGCDGVVVKRVWWRSERSGPAGGKWLLLLLWRTLQQLKQLCPFFRGFLEPRTKKFGAVFTNFLSSSARSWMFSRLLQYLLPPQLAVGKDHTGGIHTGRDHTGRDRTGRIHTGRDHTGKDCTGRDRTGRDRTGRDRTGRVHTRRLGGSTLGETTLLGGTALGGTTLGCLFRCAPAPLPTEHGDLSDTTKSRYNTPYLFAHALYFHIDSFKFFTNA